MLNCLGSQTSVSLPALFRAGAVDQGPPRFLAIVLCSNRVPVHHLVQVCRFPVALSTAVERAGASHGRRSGHPGVFLSIALLPAWSRPEAEWRPATDARAPHHGNQKKRNKQLRYRSEVFLGSQSTLIEKHVHLLMIEIAEVKQSS